jgi:hypothetical protein
LVIPEAEIEDRTLALEEDEEDAALLDEEELDEAGVLPLEIAKTILQRFRVFEEPVDVVAKVKDEDATVSLSKMVDVKAEPPSTE